MGGREVQSAGAYEFVELPLEAHLSHRSSRAKFLIDWGQRLRMERAGEGVVGGGQQRAARRARA